MYLPSNTASAHKATNPFGDTDSERNILPPPNFDGDGILRTTQVHVHAETKDGTHLDDVSEDSVDVPASTGRAY